MAGKSKLDVNFTKSEMGDKLQMVIDPCWKSDDPFSRNLLHKYCKEKREKSKKKQ